MRALQRRPRAAMLQASAVKGRSAQLEDGAINSLHGRSGWRQARRGQWHSLSACRGCGCGCGSRVAADARGWSLLTITNPSGQPQRRTPPPPKPPFHTLHALCQRFPDSSAESLHGNCSHTPPACAAARPSCVLWCLVPHLLPDHVRRTLIAGPCPRAGFTDTSSYLIHPTPSARAPIRPLGTLHHSRQSMSRGGKLAPEVNR